MRGLRLLRRRFSRIPSQPRKQKAQKEDRYLRGRQIAYVTYDYFWVTGAHDTALDYADPFTITLRNGEVQEFDT